MQQKNKLHQVILLNKAGLIHYSCDSLFDTSVFAKNPISKDFPFLESIFPSILELDINSEPLRFSKMVNPHKFLKGAYDFTFKWLKTREGSFVLWTIYDYSEVYKSIRLSQQKRHELELYKERLEAKNQSIGSIKDLQ